jgi:Domain of unknown function (DUF397)
MQSATPHYTFWKKSSYSAANGNCVEVARLAGGHISVRDSKNAAMPALGFTAAGWQAFIAELKSS